MVDISIIIPVYNSAKYLDVCLDSILKQTYKNFEVILVNDGSTDNSKDVCENYVGRDSRFYLYSIPNSGVSVARNYALEKCIGEWITYIDSDDWVEPDYLESLKRNATVGVDIVMGNFFFNRGKVETIGVCSKHSIKKKQFPSYPLALLVEDCAVADNIKISVEIICAACGKLTRKRLVNKNNIRFEEGLELNEDGLFHLMTYIKANDFVIIDKPLYHYRISATSSNYRYRPNVASQMEIWHACYKKVADDLPADQKKLFLSLSAYRMYCNIFNLFLNHRECCLSFREKIGILQECFNTDKYDVSRISKKLMLIKRVEMVLMKYRYCTALLIFSKLKFVLKGILSSKC